MAFAPAPSPSDLPVTDATTRHTIESINPATGESLGSVPVQSVAEVHAIIDRARTAQRQWAAVPAKQRARRIRRCVDYLVAHADAVCQGISRETGKPRMDALVAEVVPATMAVDYYCRMVPRWLRPERPTPSTLIYSNKSCRVWRVPIGVVGIVAPWNYPLAIPMQEILLGLLAGNAVVFKGAPETVFVSRAIAEIIGAAGLPADIFHAVEILPEQTSEAFFEGGIDKLFFTGSVRVGKLLMAQAAHTLTPVSLELGGNDPMLVCPDANIERTVNGLVWAGFTNSGQTCAAVERVYVHAEIYDAFLASLKPAVEALRVGPDTDFSVDVGSLCVDRQAVSVRDKLADALSRGARIAAQAPLPANLPAGCPYVAPTVLVDVTPEMALMRDEIFGPVVGVMKVPSMAEAVELANRSIYGLTASVWSSDTNAAVGLARQLRAGVVTINDHTMTHGMPELPWGGPGASGIGRSHGKSGFEEMTQPQAVVVERLSGRPRHYHWHPYDEKTYRQILAAHIFFYGRGLFRRLAAGISALNLLRRLFRRNRPLER